VRWIRRSLLALIALAVLGTGVIAACNSISSEDPVSVHVDPLTQKLTSKPNQYLVAPADQAADAPMLEPKTYDVPAADLAAAFDAVAMAEPRVTREAGGPDALFATYLQVSRILRFPDYVSVRAVPLSDTTSTLAIYSRSVYGHSDLGVNKARIEGWLAKLDQRLAAN
jgi:uncharacterized protein (DUF1499 family)